MILVSRPHSSNKMLNKVVLQEMPQRKPEHPISCITVAKSELLLLRQGGQQTLETLKDPEKPWIFFAPGKIPWKTLKLQHTPEKLCSEADFPHDNFWSYRAVAFFYSCNAGEENL